VGGGCGSGSEVGTAKTSIRTMGVEGPLHMRSGRAGGGAGRFAGGPTEALVAWFAAPSKRAPTEGFLSLLLFIYLCRCSCNFQALWNLPRLYELRCVITAGGLTPSAQSRVPGAPRKAAWVARALRRMQKSMLIVIWLFSLVATCYLLLGALAWVCEGRPPFRPVFVEPKIKSFFRGRRDT
jgi:hypothetical protein